jgi:hypothetical protein
MSGQVAPHSSLNPDIASFSRWPPIYSWSPTFPAGQMVSLETRQKQLYEKYLVGQRTHASIVTGIP